MMLYLENILQTTTGKSSLQDVSTEQLQQIADTYPYFAAARFLLAKKLLANNSEEFKKASQQTALHFNNTLLLHFNFQEEFIDDEATRLTIKDADKTTETNEQAIQEPIKDIVAEVENESAVNEEISKAEEDNVLANKAYEDDQVDLTDDDLSAEPAFELNEKLSTLLKEQAEAFEKPVEETALPVEAIPHHRIDYFESQGIKLDIENEANDKLGTQLRRFTDWLKQMKRISPNLNTLETDTAGEIQAQNMAARSNDPKEVITEAMAEVLIKQNKPEEAITIYEKLSFSNPSKSAYFAAKIKELKA